MKNELISIIAPCYNVADTLERYLKSILNQTYKHIEVIAVDDGSTDDTANILNQYCSVFSANKMTLKYLYEDNAGLGAAINTGLKYVTGDYLCWSDPDDFYFPASMEKRLQAFHEHPECAVVSSDAYVYHADDLEHPIKREAARFTYRQEPNQFELLLKEESHFCAGIWCGWLSLKKLIRNGKFIPRVVAKIGSCCFRFTINLSGIIWTNHCMAMCFIRKVCLLVT